MPGLAAFLLATPVFGFALAAPTLDVTWLASPAAVIDVSGSIPMAELLQVAEAAPLSADDAAQAEEDRRYSEQVRQRQEIGAVHRALGIATGSR